MSQKVDRGTERSCKIVMTCQVRKPGIFALAGALTWRVVKDGSSRS